MKSVGAFILGFCLFTCRASAEDLQKIELKEIPSKPVGIYMTMQEDVAAKVRSTFEWSCKNPPVTDGKNCYNARADRLKDLGCVVPSSDTPGCRSIDLPPNKKGVVDSKWECQALCINAVPVPKPSTERWLRQLDQEFIKQHCGSQPKKIGFKGADAKLFAGYEGFCIRPDVEEALRRERAAGDGKAAH